MQTHWLKKKNKLSFEVNLIRYCSLCKMLIQYRIAISYSSIILPSRQHGPFLLDQRPLCRKRWQVTLMSNPNSPMSHYL